MKTTGRYGIITAISPNIWNDYLLFHMSLMRHNSYQLYVVGLELQANQAEFVSRQPNTTLLPLSAETVARLNTIDNDWRKWYKPHFVLEAVQKGNLDFAVWLDADLVVTGSIDPLFERAIDTFFVVQDYFSPQHCHNKEELYTLLQVPIPADNRVLNSGVFGMALPRDKHIISAWEENVAIIHKDRRLHDSITLYDQGVLLLTLQQMSGLDYVVNNKNWNYPARRLFYEDSRHVIDVVEEDHPGALIIHYAGMPKLEHLQMVNSPQSLTYFRKRCGQFTTAKTFITGSDQLLWPIITSMRRGTKAGGWFFLAESPFLATSMQKKFRGEPIHMDPQMAYYFNREDCPFACTASPYFGPLFEDFSKHWPNANYIVMLSEPFDTIKYKFQNYLLWPHKIHECPGFYQSDYGRAVRRDHVLWYRNKHRLVVDDSVDLVGMCLNEYEWMLDKALSFVQNNPHGQVMWAKNPTSAVNDITARVDSKIFDRAWPRIVQPRLEHHPDTDQWIEEFLEPHRQRISDSFFRLLCKYRVAPFTLIP